LPPDHLLDLHFLADFLHKSRAPECMRSKRLVEFRMAPKRSSSKGKEKGAANSAPTLDDGWLASKCTESNILSLVDEYLLQPHSVVQWRPALGHSRLFEQTDEMVAFIPFIESGFGVPTCYFFCSLLFSLEDSSTPLDSKLHPPYLHFHSFVRSFSRHRAPFQPFPVLIPP